MQATSSSTPLFKNLPTGWAVLEAKTSSLEMLATETFKGLSERKILSVEKDLHNRRVLVLRDRTLLERILHFFHFKKKCQQKKETFSLLKDLWKNKKLEKSDLLHVYQLILNPSSVNPKSAHNPLGKLLIYLDEKLSHNIAEAYSSIRLTIQAAKNPLGKEIGEDPDFMLKVHSEVFFVHKEVLKSAPFFRDMFGYQQEQCVEEKNDQKLAPDEVFGKETQQRLLNYLHNKKQDVKELSARENYLLDTQTLTLDETFSKQAWEHLLNYLYGNKQQLPAQELQELYHLAEFLNMQDLKIKLIDHLFQTLKETNYNLTQTHVLAKLLVRYLSFNCPDSSEAPGHPNLIKQKIKEKFLTDVKNSPSKKPFVEFLVKVIEQTVRQAQEPSASKTSQEEVINYEGMNELLTHCLVILEDNTNDLSSIEALDRQLHELGLHYYYGRGFPQDYKRATKLLELAARVGNYNQYELGMCYLHGHGVSIDQNYAVKLLQQAAGQGNPMAQYELGMCYLNGRGMYNRNYERAAELFQQAADQGNLDAQYELGLCYYRGFGFSRNYDRAIELLQQAANQGHPKALYHLWKCYNFGYGVPRNCDHADELLEKAADQGHPKAQYELGKRYYGKYYYYGDYNDKKYPTNYYRATKLFQQAADQGHPQAQYELGMRYLYGYVIDNDQARAIELFQQAANQSHPRAQYELGMCYLYGKGVPKDEMRATKLLQQAADQACSDAQYELGMHYLHGKGILRSQIRGTELLQKAANNGNRKAKYILGK